MKTVVTVSVLFLAYTGGCGNDTSMVGQRADGVEVTCQPSPNDDVYACIPDDMSCTESAPAPALVLWPPNHKMHEITVADCLGLSTCDGDGNDATGWTLTAITCDEAIDVGQGGDGNTADYDMAIENGNAMLRSERQGGGDGRVYRMELSDADGHTATCEVHVPHDQGPVSGALDSGEASRVETN